MHSSGRSLICGASLAVALATSAAVLAIEADESRWDLSPLVSEARELVGVARQQAARLDERLSGAAPTTGAYGDFGGSFARPGSSNEYSELRRTVTRLGEIGNEVVYRVSPCGGDSRKIAADFRSRTRRLTSSLSRVASSSMEFASMMLADVEKELGAVEQQLQAVATLRGCKRGDDAEPEQDAGQTG
jgi:hypothetical protein